MSSTRIANKNGDNTEPWRTPNSIMNSADHVSNHLMLVRQLVKRFSTIVTIEQEYFITHQFDKWSMMTLSKAFDKSIAHKLTVNTC